MFTPAIRAIEYPSSAPQGEMPYLVARNPLPNEKPTRARMRRRKPVKRDELQIGLALALVKSAKRSDRSSVMRAREKRPLNQPLCLAKFHFSSLSALGGHAGKTHPSGFRRQRRGEGAACADRDRGWP